MSAPETSPPGAGSTCRPTGCRRHPDSVGVLVAQLGTPAAPTPRALRKYLGQFLADPRVIEANRLVWRAVLHGIILRTRPRRSARLYARIWRPDGSPLLTITAAQTAALSARLGEGRAHVRFGMRYGEPSIASAVEDLVAAGCKRIVLLPMYPQYSAATTASTYDAVFSALAARRWVPTVRVVEPYFAHPLYVRALADSMNESLASLPERPGRLVLSYHGIPEKYVERGDPYCCHCTETTRALLPLLDYPKENVIHTYQSRFGRDPWLVPYTDETLEALARSGTENVAVAAPGFTADCLETLDELGNEGSEQFREHGGKRLDALPCLNTHPSWIAAMAGILEETAGDWLACPGPGRPLAGEGPVECPVAAAKKAPTPKADSRTPKADSRAPVATPS